MPAAAIIPSAISAGTSLIGGLLGSHAAKSAAQIQADAAAKAAADAKAAGERQRPISPRRGRRPLAASLRREIRPRPCHRGRL